MRDLRDPIAILAAVSGNWITPIPHWREPSGSSALFQIYPSMREGKFCVAYIDTLHGV